MRGVSFTFWSLNPDSGDTGGILADDWLADPRPALAGALIRGGRPSGQGWYEIRPSLVQASRACPRG